MGAKALAVPLVEIYNYSFVNRLWPTIWKRETVVPIPKVPTPTGFGNIRPISMTTLWSKIMESYIAGYTLLETGSNWQKINTVVSKGLVLIMYLSLIHI